MSKDSSAFTRLKNIAQCILLSLGGLATAMLIVLTFGDVITRNLFNYPIPGALEMSEYWSMVTLVSVGIWWSGVIRDHVQVTLMTETLGPKTKRAFDILVEVISTIFLLSIALVSFQQAAQSMKEGEYAGAYMTIIWPVRYVFAIGFAAYAFVSVVHMVKLFNNVDEKSNDRVQAGDIM